MLRDVASGLY